MNARSHCLNAVAMRVTVSQGAYMRDRFRGLGVELIQQNLAGIEAHKHTSAKQQPANP